MGKPLIDMVGYRVHRLTVIARGGKIGKSTGANWVCQCDCGNQTVVAGQSLRRGDIKSCGCYNSEVAKANMTKLSTKHSMSDTRLYRIWRGMKVRCLSSNDKYYPRYGARGITICKEWASDFMTFANWALVNGYSDELSLDRIENNGGYEPQNCRWATQKTQANNRMREGNKKNTRFVIYNNKTYALSEFAEKYLTINMDTFWSRLQHGMTVDDAMTTLKRKNQFG